LDSSSLIGFVGQSSSSSNSDTSTSLPNVIVPAARQTPQQSLAEASMQKLMGPGTAGSKILQAIPVDSSTENRIAGQIFTYLGGPGAQKSPQAAEDNAPSYSSVNSKLADNKYTQQGIQAGATGSAPGYTGA
jgi:hypothetical protein